MYLKIKQPEFVFTSFIVLNVALNQDSTSFYGFVARFQIKNLKYDSYHELQQSDLIYM